MKKENQLKQQEKYPLIYRDLWGDPRKTCMAFGIDVGDGWLELIDNLCAAIVALEPGANFKADQVKEKFGGLRFYVSGADKEKASAIDKLIAEAEKDSYNICEYCGTRENVTVEGRFWILTLCANCRDVKDSCQAFDTYSV